MMDLIKIQKIDNHSKIKKVLLDSILKNPGVKWTNNNSDKEINYNVSNTDWQQKKSGIIQNDGSIWDYSEFYVKNIKPYFKKYDFVNCDRINVHNVWYHQYLKDDFHGWHVHGECQFASIYYLELPDKKHCTEFYDSINSKLVKFDTEEGDLIIFPSFIPHQSPKILDNSRKTIISANFSFDYLNKASYEF